ncbi:hypothetical protein CUJ83_06905 [Methanocella sp. CWC-04]|uniref:DUF5667 domain-containing protein n=2 Tax=Methanooceanicella nereidis TaxID=2052831 RepID=A0AAP2RD75_9EURY|nr:hypothetical protein [Methanocella sp. CWC-04]
MVKKIIGISVVLLFLISIIPTSMAQSEDVKEYKGMVGADSPLYKIKLWFQKLDESISSNANEKLQKKLNHAEERLAEARAMARVNNTEAMELALNEYCDLMDDVNETMEDPEIGEEEYSEVGPIVQKHQNTFKYMLNNTTENKWQLMNAFNYSLQVMNGKSFVYYNNTTYFVPPGHLKNGNNKTFLPPGLAKKGIKAMPTIINGSTPFNYDYNYDYDYSNLYNGSKAGQGQDKVKNNNKNKPFPSSVSGDA